MKDRDRNLVVRIDDHEHDQLRALAEAADLPASILVRQWIRDHYSARFGDVQPRRAK